MSYSMVNLHIESKFFPNIPNITSEKIASERVGRYHNAIQ